MAYYFDASDAAASDPGSVWFGDANAFDSSAATFASCTTSGSTASNYLMAEGTQSPITGPTISYVQARIVGSDSDDDAFAMQANAAVYTNGLAELLGTAVIVTSGVVTYGPYTALSTPSGGWTWQKVNDLEVKIYRTTVSSLKQLNVCMVELNVYVNHAAPGNTGGFIAVGDGMSRSEVSN